MKKQIIIIIVAIVMVSAFVIGGYFYTSSQDNKASSLVQKNSSLLEKDGAITIGNPDAKVHIVEFFDPACETCAQFHPFVKNILKENKGKIKLTLRYATFHEGSEYIVKILEAAKKQGKYLETLDLAFQTQSHWAIHHKANPEIFWRFLPKIGLDMKKLAKDVMDPKLDKLIAQDMKDAKALGANKTPSYFVNGKPLQKFGYQELKDLINSEL